MDVVYRDEHIVVADKPHFLATTPRGSHVVETALARLRRELDIPALGAAHRLDRLTAGLVLFIVRPEERGAYQVAVPRPAGARRSTRRSPRTTRAPPPATVRSRILKERGVLAAQEVEGEVNAVSRVELSSTDDGLARYRLVPSTGQTHQLRVHMSALGVPILGDPLYPVVTDPVPAGDFRRPLQLLARAWSSPIRSRGTSTGSVSPRVLGPGPRTATGPVSNRRATSAGCGGQRPVGGPVRAPAAAGTGRARRPGRRAPGGRGRHVPTCQSFARCRDAPGGRAARRRPAGPSARTAPAVPPGGGEAMDARQRNSSSSQSSWMSGQAHQQRVDAHVGDGTADVLARALVRAAAEGEVRAVAHHVGLEVGPHPGVHVARRGREQQSVALADALAAQLRVLLGEVGEDGAERRLVPQGLLDRLGHGHLAAVELGAEARVGEHHAQHVGEEVGRGLVGGEEDDAQVLPDLVVGEPRRVGDEVAGEVLLRAGPGAGR
jgi:tRNA pseudouridine32 synthase/23S rRNA pseudouridine746 synthase